MFWQKLKSYTTAFQSLDLGCTIMTKITIVDYSLEIVIAIIDNDFFEQIFCHCLKLHAI